jgi:hypothetical protein
MALAPGTRIGAYEIAGPLGAGGMGEVYRAHDAQLGRDVAVKTLPAAFADDPERVARFEREARILATLNHPNIATLYGFERQGGTLALVMELVDGDTLHEHLLRSGATGRGLPVSEVIALARQVVDALDAAHEKGIVHRDLKPANIKLTPDGLVKVLDFGLAKAIAADSGSHQTETRTLSPAETRPNAVMGTAAYMSPEQARGLPLDRRTDIWAFGCVLYEMLAGQPAFARSTSSDTIAAVLTSEVDWSVLPSRTPPALRQLLGRCLERTTKARLRDIADARPYLDEAVAPSSSITSGALAPAPAPREGMSRRALFASGAALGLVGAGLGATLVTPRRDPVPLPSFQRLTFRRGLIRTARFGPDFQTVFYGAQWDGDDCRTYTVRLESPESSALALPPGAPMAISSTGEIALALGAHKSGIMTYGTLARVAIAGGAPRALQEQVKYADWAPDGRELAIVRRDGLRDVLEFPAGTVIAEPERRSGGFAFPRLSPKGDAIAAFELDGSAWLRGRVVILDRSGKRQAASPTYPNVFGLAWHGDAVWFTAAEELPLLRNTLHAMNGSGAVRVVARLPGNASVHDIAPDGRVLLARTDDRSGISVQVPGEPGQRDLSWLDSPNLADLSADGRHLLFYELGVGGGPNGTIYLRGTDGSAPVRLGEGQAYSLSPDGRWVLASADGAHLALIPTGAGAPARLEREGLRMLTARWLADGQRAVVAARTGNEPTHLYVLDVWGTGTTRVSPDDVPLTNDSWAPSPDGTMVAVTTAGGPKLLAVTGGPARPVPGVTDPWRVVGWIQRGLLLSPDPADGAILSVDPATGRREPWADIKPSDPAGLMNLNVGRFVATPDGRGYGYGWHRALSDLYLVRGWS